MNKSGVMKFCGLFVAAMLGSSGLVNAQSVLPPGGASYDAWKSYVNNYSKGGSAARPTPTREARPDFTKGLGKSTIANRPALAPVQRQAKVSAPAPAKRQAKASAPKRRLVSPQPTSQMIASAPFREPAPFKELKWFPNRGKRTGIFAVNQVASTVSGYDGLASVTTAPEQLEVVASNIRPSRGQAGCQPNVQFRYSDRGFVVRHVANPASSYSGQNRFKAAYPTSYVNAYTAPNRAKVRAYREGRGCNARIVAEWSWIDPMEIVMRPPNGANDCVYRRTLEHEKEHVRIYQQTPREYEGRIKQLLANSRNPEADYRAFYNQLLSEMQRRHNALDNSHFAHSMRGFCS